MHGLITHLHPANFYCSWPFGKFEDAISVKFLPALTGRPLSDIERSIFSTRRGGLGIGGFLTLDLIHL